jgi:hypothetical protein
LVACASGHRQPRHAVAVGALVVALAGTLRWIASLDDLWLDEIWSWWIVQTSIRSPLDVILTIQHENNHFLNTWWIVLLGPDAAGVWYRLPAVVLGTLTVSLARMAVARAGADAVRIVTLLVLPSYLLVHYSSEARGYAYQLFFSLAAYVLLDRRLAALEERQKSGERGDQDLSDRALFAGACVLGCLGHPGFLITFVALASWALVASVRVLRAPVPAIGWTAGLFMLPGVLLSGLWVVNLSRMANGGGPDEEPWLVALQSSSLAVGGPGGGWAAIAIGLAVSMLVAIALAQRLRERDDRWIVAVLTAVIPALLIAFADRREVYPRYFLVTILFGYLLLAEHLARWSSRGAAARIAVAIFLVLSLLGNGWQIARLYREGRGHGEAVLKLIADASPPGPITIGSDAPYFRHARLLQYFGRRLGVQGRLRYFAGRPWPEQGARWVLLHSQSEDWRAESVYHDAHGNAYELVRLFPYAGLSGWQTGVYRSTRADGE